MVFGGAVPQVLPGDELAGGVDAMAGAVGGGDFSGGFGFQAGLFAGGSFTGTDFEVVSCDPEGSSTGGGAFMTGSRDRERACSGA